MLCSTRVPAAGSSCLVDLESGQTILSESSSDRIENTAIAALMSAYTALALAEERNESLDTPLADVSNKSEFRKSESNLADAIEAVLLAADKEALQAIVRHFSADEATFVIEMNTKAHQLGMEQSFSEHLIQARSIYEIKHPQRTPHASASRFINGTRWFEFGLQKRL